MMFCPFAVKAWSITGYIESGGTNPNGLIFVELRDSIALIVTPDSSVVHPWGIESDYSAYQPAGNITIPSSIYYNGNSFPVRIIGYKALFGCNGITSITIPNTVSEIHNLAFMSGIWNNTVTGGYLSSVIYTGTIAQWCNIYFSGSYANPTTFGATLTINNNLVNNLVIPNDITMIRQYAFSGCSSLTSVTIPASVTCIDDGAFKNCANLTTCLILK